MDTDEYCREKIAIPGSSYYYSTLFLPPERRQALNIVYAFKAEMEDSLLGPDPGLGRIKLQWWRDELGRTLEGAPQHPLTRGIGRLIARYGLAPTDFLAIIASIERRLNRAHYPSYSDLKYDYLQAAEAPAKLACTITACAQKETPQVVGELWAAIDLAYSLQDLRAQVSQGYLPLPTDEMAHYGVVSFSNLSSTTPQTQALITLQIARLEHDLTLALARLPDPDRLHQLHTITMGRIVLATLNEVQRDGCRLLEYRTTLTPLRKLWIAWSTRRKESKRQRKYLFNYVVTKGSRA
jgi:15-cis-phytoene synthase